MQFSDELIQKGRAAKSPEELLALAKESGMSITAEQASAYFGRLNGSGELSDEELDDVSGGCDKGPGTRTCPYCGGPVNIYPEGDYCDSCGRRFW